MTGPLSWLRRWYANCVGTRRLADLAEFTPTIDLTERRRWPGFGDVVERSAAEGLLDEDDVARLTRRERA